ncbi:hypothetical protein [Streptomyces kronopolitis]
MGEDLGEQQIGAGGAGEGAVEGEVAELLEVAALDGTPDVAVCGEHPPTSDRSH